jgi:tetratricopeptide (TPR) repeat protein
MERPSLAVHRTIVVVDVEEFGDRCRTSVHQVAVRAGLYHALRRAFDRAGVSWDACDHEDRGDGVVVLAPAETPKTPLVDAVPHALVKALREHNTTHAVAARIRLRMAVHAGEVTYDRHGFTSTAVNVAFRLLDAAPLKTVLAESPGVLAVITSGWFFDEVVRHSPACDAAAYRPVRICVKETSMVAWIGRPDHPFPPVPAHLTAPPTEYLADPDPNRYSVSRSAPRPRAGQLLDGLPVPRQLPLAIRDFVGRAEYLAALDALAPDGSDSTGPSGTVLIDGTAGVGKTALAVWWAHRAAAEFPDGQLYVDLRGFSPGEPVSPMEALSGFLRALGTARPEEFVGLAERAARFRTLMSGRRMAIVLDNARSAQQIAPLLPGAGPAVVLVTSRGQMGELHVTHSAMPVRLEPLSRTDGVRLLAAALGDRVVTEKATTDRLAALCGGLPLALRIVAERLVSRPALTLETLADELDDERSRLASLSSLSASANVRAVFSWSYRQLDAVAATVFRAVGLGPRRGFDAAAIAAVAGHQVVAVERALADLGRVHLVTELAAGRYDMHDLLRAYAVELAEERDDPSRGDATRRLFDYYLHSVDRADRLLTPHRMRIPLVGDQQAGRHFPDVTTARRWLLAEERNLVALSRLDDPELDTYRWQLAYVLRDYFYLTRQLDGWIETHTNALDAACRSASDWAEALTRNNLGMAMTAAGRLDEGMRLFETAKEAFDRLGDGMGTSNSLANIASVLRRQGDPVRALAYQRKALAHYRREGAMWHAGITLRGMAHAHVLLGQATEAVRCAEEAVDIATWLSYDLDIAQGNNILGTAHRLRGDLTLAEIAYQQALDMARRCGSRFEEAWALRGLGSVALMAHRPDEARRYWHAARTLYRSIGSTLVDAVTEDLAQLTHPESGNPRTDE